MCLNSGKVGVITGARARPTAAATATAPRTAPPASATAATSGRPARPRATAPPPGPRVATTASAARGSAFAGLAGPAQRAILRLCPKRLHNEEQRCTENWNFIQIIVQCGSR